MTRDEKDRQAHPAKLWYNRWFWHDRSDQPVEIQVVDILHDIRLLLFVILLVLIIS